MTTAITAFRAGIPLINLNYGSTVPLSFIGKLANQLAPISIANCFSKFSILNHVFYTQTVEPLFNRDLFHTTPNTETFCKIQQLLLARCAKALHPPPKKRRFFGSNDKIPLPYLPE